MVSGTISIPLENWVLCKFGHIQGSGDGHIWKKWDASMLIFGIAIWPFFENTVSYHLSLAFFDVVIALEEKRHLSPLSLKTSSPSQTPGWSLEERTLPFWIPRSPKACAGVQLVWYFGFLVSLSFGPHLPRVRNGSLSRGTLALIRDKRWRLRLYKIIRLSHFHTSFWKIL